MITFFIIEQGLSENKNIKLILINSSYQREAKCELVLTNKNVIKIAIALYFRVST